MPEIVFLDPGKDFLADGRCGPCYEQLNFRDGGKVVAGPVHLRANTLRN